MSCPFFIYTWQSSLLLVATGAILGSLGFRGAWLLLPVLLLALRVPLELAVPTTVAVVGFVALSGTWDAWMERRLDLRRSAWFGFPVAAMSALASLVATSWIPSGILLWSFLVSAILVAVRTMVGNSPASRESSSPPPSRLATVAWGAWNGILVGGFGVGSTSTAVPRGEPKSAVTPQTFLAGIALGAVASLVVHIDAGNFRWTMALPAVLAVTLGMEIGGWSSKKLPYRALELSFGAMLLVLAGVLVWRSSGH